MRFLPYIRKSLKTNPRKVDILKTLAAVVAVSAIFTVDVHAQAVTNVFQMQDAFPAHNALLSQLKACLAQKDFTKMQAVCSNAVAIFPKDAIWHYNLACAETRLGRLEAARAALTRAADCGFADADGMASDEDLAIIRRDPAYISALAGVRDNARNPGKAPGAVSPLPLAEFARITPSNTSWDMTLGGFKALFTVPERLPQERSTTEIPGLTGDLIRGWIEAGTAAGNYGDIYDNHDLGHSVLDTSFFPGLTPVKYCQEAHAAGVDTGVSLFDFHGRPAFGNSSTANTQGPYWGSCARRAQNSFIRNLLVQYLSNTIYVYPQHHDYLEAKHGDVFATRTPYLFISPGSSWTDRPILASLATALAALRPETKEMLTKSGQIAPTLQYLLRMAQSNVVEMADYLKPAAHPVVFNGNNVDTIKLARLAHSIETNSLPPLAPLRVLDDDSARYRPIIDYPDSLGERVYDTPFAIARVWRAPSGKRKMSLAVGTPGDEDITYHWFVGQGDPAKVLIREIDSHGRRVEIEVRYHDPRFNTPFGVRSSRVDVICVADNGTHCSAPSFVTWFFPPNEKREYGIGMKPIAIDYASCATNYVDPEYSPPKDFRDEFIRDDTGALDHVRRTYADGREEIRGKRSVSGGK